MPQKRHSLIHVLFFLRRKVPKETPQKGEKGLFETNRSNSNPKSSVFLPKTAIRAEQKVPIFSLAGHKSHIFRI